MKTAPNSVLSAQGTVWYREESDPYACRTYARLMDPSSLDRRDQEGKFGHSSVFGRAKGAPG